MLTIQRYIQPTEFLPRKWIYSPPCIAASQSMTISARKNSLSSWFYKTISLPPQLRVTCALQIPASILLCTLLRKHANKYVLPQTSCSNNISKYIFICKQVNGYETYRNYNNKKKKAKTYKLEFKVNVRSVKKNKPLPD